MSGLKKQPAVYTIFREEKGKQKGDPVVTTTSQFTGTRIKARKAARWMSGPDVKTWVEFSHHVSDDRFQHEKDDGI